MVLVLRVQGSALEVRSAHLDKQHVPWSQISLSKRVNSGV